METRRSKADQIVEGICIILSNRAVFKWLSKVITWLWLLRLVIGLKDSRQFFNQWESKPKPKPIAPCTRYFSRALSELHVIARNCDWFMELSAPVVIGRSNFFGFGFSTVIWKPLYFERHCLSSSGCYTQVEVKKGSAFRYIGWSNTYFFLSLIRPSFPCVPSTFKPEKLLGVINRL